MYLSYSGYKNSGHQNAGACQLTYWHSYIGKTPPARPDDRLGSIFGTAIGRLFEVFYKDELWRQKGTREVLEGKVEEIVTFVLEDEQKPKRGRPGGVLLWKKADEERWGYSSPEEIVDDIKTSIPKGLTTIKQNILLARDVRAELKLDSKIEGHLVGGRADFVMTRVAHKDTVIIDGKGTRRLDRVDPDQLKWYSMLFREQVGRLPDRTAFLYWRFEPPVGISWFEFTDFEIDSFKAKVISAIQRIESLQKEAPEKTPPAEVRDVFKPSANPNNCRFCPYATEALCPEGFAVVRELERKKAERTRERKVF